MTGATGFLGRPLTHRLLREGHSVTALVRNRDTAAALLGSQVTLLDQKASDMSLVGALSKTDAVINLAGEPVVDQRWTKARRRALYDSRIGTTQRLARIVSDLPNRPSTFISGSAVGYYGSNHPEALNESSSKGSGFLARLCGDWEHQANALSVLGVRVVALRTGIVLGHHGGALPRLLGLFRLGLGGQLGDGSQMMPWIHVHDMLNVIMRALHDPAIKGPVNAVSPNPVSNREFTDELACAVGRRAHLRVPGVALRLAMGNAASVLLGGQNARPEKLLRHGFEFRYESLAPALHDLVSGQAPVTIQRAETLPPSNYLRRRGARYQLTHRTVIDAPLDEVFRFFSNAENLSLLSPANLKFKIESKLPITMAPGAGIEYTIGIHGIPMHWKTEIETWKPQECFVDTQLSGPYRSWWHEHRFEALGNRTIMHDQVLYSPPLGPLGYVANRLKIASMLKEIFGYRQKAIALHFSTSSDDGLQAVPALRIA